MDLCCRCRRRTSTPIGRWRGSPARSGRTTARSITSNAVADDVKVGKRTSFPRSVKLKRGEVVVFSYIVYKSRADRDRCMKNVMKDKRLAKMMDPKKMPFDGKRMFWGGFKAKVEL